MDVSRKRTTPDLRGDGRPKRTKINPQDDTDQKETNFEKSVNFVAEIVSNKIPRDLIERLVLHVLYSGKYDENPLDHLINLCVSGTNFEEWLKGDDATSDASTDPDYDYNEESISTFTDTSTSTNASKDYSTTSANTSLDYSPISSKHAKKTFTTEHNSKNDSPITPKTTNEVNTSPTYLDDNDSFLNYSAISSNTSTPSKPKTETSKAYVQSSNNTSKDMSSVVEDLSFFLEPEKQCAICLTEYMVSEMYTVNCDANHRFCFECFKHHVGDKVKEGKLVNCPAEKCDYVLQLSDIEELALGKETQDKYESILLNQALQTLNAIGCPTRNCGNYVVPNKVGDREMCECPKCKLVFCSLCQRKYHYRTTCEEVDKFEKSWVWWCETGREEYWQKKGTAEVQYKKQLQTYLKAKGIHDKALKELQKRIREEEKDEEWKAKHCRHCPKCNRTINKIEGCDKMRCGTDFHGGNAQNGCGKSFQWNKAKPYIPRLTSQRSAPPTLSAKNPDDIAGIDNGPYTCEICEKTIKGLRFSCLHCQMYDVCEECEATGICIHNDHVFNIINL